jgi:hypothetical protein
MEQRAAVLYRASLPSPLPQVWIRPTNGSSDKAYVVASEKASLAVQPDGRGCFAVIFTAGPSVSVAHPLYSACDFGLRILAEPVHYSSRFHAFMPL